ncbi:hypothetical protein GCM10009678_85410 [Actinomadura kijaniata]|uniref:DUF4142 domain-containing protein n=1 Tax=Actinomadura kijaniata TaxID=46161 RepID=UPI002FEDA0D6
MRKSYGRRMRRMRRMANARWMLAAGAAVAVALAALVVLGRSGTSAGNASASVAGNPTGTVQTRWGPLSATDRSLLEAVRRAGLWEMPAGQQAQERASSAKVKEVADIIMEQHMRLDADVRATAAKLGVMLPIEPNADQKRWLAELSSKAGPDYDQTFVLRLRAAHGKVFGVIAKTRASTENTEIRAFAERSLRYVNTHMALLESTGLATKASLAS